jgi:SHS2 domain-containing protein
MWMLDRRPGFLPLLPLRLMPPSRPDWLREIDHTGDVGIVVDAASLEQLFARAAAGMFWVLTDPPAVRPREDRSVSVSAPDRDALLVRWLSELNFIHTTEHVLFSDFDVSVEVEDDDLTLTATCRGEPVDRDRHTVYTEIKAVTFHGLHVDGDDETGWTVQVIFDM